MRWRHMFYLTGLPGWVRFGRFGGWGGMPLWCLAYPRFVRRWPAFPLRWTMPWWWQPPSPEQEREWLSTWAQTLEEELAAIKKRLEELKPEKNEGD